MAQRLAAAMESLDRASLEAQQSTTRSRREVDEQRELARAEAASLRQQVEALKAQVKDGAEAAAGLQELLVQQQKVAEGYRAEAQRSLAQFAQLEATQPHLQQALHSYHEHERAEREKLATQLVQQQSQLQRALTSSLAQQRSESWSEYKNGLEELRAELRAGQGQLDLQRQSVEAARQVVM